MNTPSPFPSADYDQQHARAEQAAEIAKTLADLEDAGWEPDHLEDRNSFSRYSIGCGISFWCCPDCGSIEADPDDGCERCGFGTVDLEELAA